MSQENWFDKFENFIKSLSLQAAVDKQPNLLSPHTAYAQKETENSENLSDDEYNRRWAGFGMPRHINPVDADDLLNKWFIQGKYIGFNNAQSAMRAAAHSEKLQKKYHQHIADYTHYWNDRYNQMHNRQLVPNRKHDNAFTRFTKSGINAAYDWTFKPLANILSGEYDQIRNQMALSDTYYQGKFVPTRDLGDLLYAGFSVPVAGWGAKAVYRFGVKPFLQHAMKNSVTKRGLLARSPTHAKALKSVRDNNGTIPNLDTITSKSKWDVLNGTLIGLDTYDHYIRPPLDIPNKTSLDVQPQNDNNVPIDSE